ncbi:hypothetical protein ZWY2020_055534 [Hordeum vulgare]|nr:hypothetical protein ZWY2020_055534 [Hordeum vulgare]
MNWVGRKIHLYNVNIGLYMLDWWERYLFNTLMLCLLWYILRYLTGFFQSNLETILHGANYLLQVDCPELLAPLGSLSSAMFYLVISIPAILLLLVLALGCYMLGRNRGRAEAAAPQQFAPPAPPK